MNVLIAFIILNSLQLRYCQFEEAESEGQELSHNKTYREVEAFTTILLDNESFTILPEEKHPVVKPSMLEINRKDGLKRLGKLNHSQKGRKYNINESAIKSHNAVGHLGRKSIAHSAEMLSDRHQSKTLSNKHAKNARLPKKKLSKRHFEHHVSYYFKPSEGKRSKTENDLGHTYRFVPTEAPQNSVYKSQTKSFFPTTARNLGEKALTIPNQNEDFEDFNFNPWENAQRLTTTNEHPADVKPFPSSLAPAQLDPSNPKRNSLSRLPPNNRNSSSSDGNMGMISYENDDMEARRSTGSWMTTAPPVHSMTFHQADIIQRNLALEEKKHKKSGVDNLTGEGPDLDDTVITFDSTCDQIVNQNSCIIQREVGDVLTLALKINSPKNPRSFQIRWMKVYHKFDSNKGKPLEIESGKLPWNMVSGSEGKELRLNPVTNSDMDPNCFVAKVFLLTKNRGKMLFTQLKNMLFRIEIPIIDMAKIYAGEELSINIENFISLPERGNLLFQWNLETKPREYVSLPSNIKVSTSGRSVVLKELKKGRLGVLNCVIYSSNRYAIAKRRFNILKVVENVKRRSVSSNLQDDSRSRDLVRSRRCRHVIRRSQEEAKQRLIDGNKPKSRQKRFRRRESIRRRSSDIDCEPLRVKMYSRFVRSLLRDLTTEDPRLMPLEKLFELSEKGDGTLDDVIPREVHYVNPKVKLIPGTSAERSVDHPVSTNCTKHSDCTEDAVCVFQEDLTNSTVRIGNCYCRPEYYRDGTKCRKIPSSNHREKRLKRNARNDFAVKQNLFYHNTREIARSTPDILEMDEITEHPKVLAFEEDESFLISDCIDDKDCSMHANCVQPTNGHPYCKCRPGFRGNGIFCWETMDYVPPEEQFLSDEEMDTMDQPLQPEIPMAVKSTEPQEIEEDT